MTEVTNLFKRLVSVFRLAVLSIEGFATYLKVKQRTLLVLQKKSQYIKKINYNFIHQNMNNRFILQIVLCQSTSFYETISWHVPFKIPGWTEIWWLYWKTLCFWNLWPGTVSASYILFVKYIFCTTNSFGHKVICFNLCSITYANCIPYYRENLKRRCIKESPKKNLSLIHVIHWFINVKT